MSGSEPLRDDMIARKNATRKAAFAAREAAHAQHRAAASDALMRHLAGLQGRVIAGYLPIRTEADPMAAMTALAANNTIVVPVVVAKAAPLVFRQWHPGVALIEGAFGVMIPEEGPELAPDHLIVPLLAFDERLYRLGYGGGFYDRTLEQLRQTKQVTATGFAYGAQQRNDIPLEPTDLPLDEMVTEVGVITPAAHLHG